MDDVLSFVLDGLEQALELERELGVRSVEIDRTLLEGEGLVQRPRPTAEVKVSAAADLRARPRPVLSSSPQPQPQPQPSTSALLHDLVFLHDRPLSPAGVEMIAKIVTALGRTAENTPVVVVPPAPQAKVTVVLGGRAMRLYFPEMRGEPGQWVKASDGRSVLITYSPEYILRFGAVTPAVQKLKQDMWRSLKAVVQHLR